MNIYSEDAAVEQPAIALFAKLGYETQRCHNSFGNPDLIGRITTSEVVLTTRLEVALKRLNPTLPNNAIKEAIEELTDSRAAMSLVHANRDVYCSLKNGVKVTFRDSQGRERVETVRIIDWDTPTNNDYLLVSQMVIMGEVYERRPDLIGFVNGLPLIFIELKAPNKPVKDGFINNLRDYKDTIPHLFWYNALVIVSNGTDARVGSISANWEHFAEWKRIEREDEKPDPTQATLIRGLCEKAPLLDIVENFTLFNEANGTPVKVIAKNHQYLGVNNAIARVSTMDEDHGRLGVFWHTQGSGKSFSMVFFAQKILRKIPGNWTFVVVTDRDDLDSQIYKTFAGVGAVSPSQHVQATSGEHLKQLLREDHRYVFTLIEKFRTTEKGEKYPTLSTRDNIIVITDETHRSQYDTFADNMRFALPNAGFIGFTGTPLIEGEEHRTRDVFGEYVSIYDFKQSIEDGATVPLYYENRIPEVQLTNTDLNNDVADAIGPEELDPTAQRRLDTRLVSAYQIITREDRLERIAEDIVAHFMGRGQTGKAMVVAIDKLTTVKMYEKVQKYWQTYLEKLKARLSTADPTERDKLVADIAFMEQTDMAVVISSAQNEVADFREKGVDILPHRKRMQREDLETKFKDPADPFRIVFVCAMWMTGFDVPSLSTIYLDKPMRNHTLMQTIARANRVFGDKTNGLIVDYVGVFRDLQNALKIYAGYKGASDGAPDASSQTDETPIKDKSYQINTLRQAITETRALCAGCGINVDALLAARGDDLMAMIRSAREALLINDETKKRFFALTTTIVELYRSVLPDEARTEFSAERYLFATIADNIRSLAESPDIAEMLSKAEDVLDDSIYAERYVIRVPVDSDDMRRYVDLSQIDFAAIKKRFATGNQKRSEAETLKGLVDRKLQHMIQLNRSRTDYQQQFQALIRDYNAGAANVEEFFTELVRLAQELTAEQQRAVAEGLSEAQLAIFDVLTKPDKPLTPQERDAVKKAARDVLHAVREALVLDWRKRQQSRAKVRTIIQDVFEQELPQSYDSDAYNEKCNAVYQHIYSAYADSTHSIYDQAA